MSRSATIALAAALAIGAAPAALAQSQLARDVLPELRRAGVSASCIGTLSQHDFAVLKSVMDHPERSPGNKLQQMKFLAERSCGETRSFLFDMFR
ncbi:hypothetical protein [Rhodovulum euryhalinum]|jgi:hypothetical protein|uniref:Uncharacterized protein n=1 Tax=Rhodovulum euryhalinum TaxID=35805 RepID=A0A4R2KNN3_9RHOB|nr:hypothetical protein [Rhodovulum euryhalinum]TCO72419.1 hypothetical protein EV655_104106 [Rhodovulum euryhalinum]